MAVKVFRIARGQLETMNELLKEARIMYSLSHPNVLQLLGIAMRGKRVKKEAEERPREEEVGLLVNDNEYAEDMLDLSNQVNAHICLASTLNYYCSGCDFVFCASVCGKRIRFRMDSQRRLRTATFSPARLFEEHLCRHDVSARGEGHSSRSRKFFALMFSRLVFVNFLLEIGQCAA